MSSIDQALAAVDATCPPMTSSEPDYYVDGHRNGSRDKENVTPTNKHKENVDSNLIDALVRKVNQAITPPSNSSKDRIHDLNRRQEGTAFDTRRILDGLPPVVNHNINHSEYDDILPVEMSMASIDYLKRHNLLPSSRNNKHDNGYRSNIGGRRSLD